MGSLRIGTQRLFNISRCLTQTKRISHRKFSAYEGEGKTIAKVLTKGDTETFCVDSVHKFGFTLTNEMLVCGPVIIFPHALISWNIDSAEDINEDSLSLFTILEPKVEMVIIGFGSREEYTRDVQIRIFNACKKLKLNYEAMATEDAIGTFNFLSLDHRYIAGAFLPLKRITFFGMDKTLEEMEHQRETQPEKGFASYEDIKRIPKSKDYDEYSKKKFGQEEV